MSASTFSVTIAMTLDVPSLRWNLQVSNHVALPLLDVFLVVCLPEDFDIYRLHYKIGALDFLRLS